MHLSGNILQRAIKYIVLTLNLIQIVIKAFYGDQKNLPYSTRWRLYLYYHIYELKKQTIQYVSHCFYSSHPLLIDFSGLANWRSQSGLIPWSLPGTRSLPPVTTTGFTPEQVGFLFRMQLEWQIIIKSKWKSWTFQAQSSLVCGCALSLCLKLF